jgi:predicted transcriptional regulator
MNENPNAHELDANGAETYPETLRITVESAADVFEEARDQSTTDGVADTAVRSFESIADVRQLLTDRRVEVMRAIMTDTPESITSLADRLDRNYADVHSDVQVLADHHIVYFETDGRSKRPMIPYDRVHLDIEIAGDTAPDRVLA